MIDKTNHVIETNYRLAFETCFLGVKAKTKKF